MTEVFVMNADGSGQINVSRGAGSPGTSSRIAWSPDGSRLLFDTDRDGNSEIYVVDSDGSNLRNLTLNAAGDSYPGWSPDGARTVFRTNRITTNAYELWIMDADGTDPSQLTNFGSDGTHSPYAPQWSPSGSLISFVRRPDPGLPSLWTIAPSGISQGTVILNAASTGVSDIPPPEWAPDGSTLILDWWHDANNLAREVWSIVPGSNPVMLTDNVAHDRAPRWSPSGSNIVFESERDGDSEIYVMQATGAGQVNATNDPGTDLEPDWGRCP